MKKKLMITTLVIVLVCSAGFAFATDWSDRAERRDYDTFDDTRFLINLDWPGTAQEIFAVCSSADTKDYFLVRRKTSGIIDVELDLEGTGIDADIWLLRPNGARYIPGYTSGESKIIDNIYIPTEEMWGLEIEYKSGIPEKPYQLRVKIDPATYSQASNIEDVPEELLK